MGSPSPLAQVGLPGDPADYAIRRRQVITGATTLTVAQSGALCVWNSATGYTFTLPVITANDVGTWFDFFVSVTNTATACKIITGAASSFLIGEVLTYIEATTPGANPGPKGFSFNGTTHVACTMGGSDTTAGGVAGTRVRVEALSATQWAISGTVVAAGTIVTPAATS
jgi:hypothetical protein